MLAEVRRTQATIHRHLQALSQGRSTRPSAGRQEAPNDKIRAMRLRQGWADVAFEDQSPTLVPAALADIGAKLAEGLDDDAPIALAQEVLYRLIADQDRKRGSHQPRRSSPTDSLSPNIHGMLSAG